MFKPARIQYSITDKLFQDKYRIQKLRNYRYLNDFPIEISDKSLSLIQSTIKSVKVAYSCQVPQKQCVKVLLCKLGKTLRKIRSANRPWDRYLESHSKSSRLLICVCKELTTLDLVVDVEDVAKGKFRTSFKALQKLEAAKLYPSEKDIEYLPGLVKRKHLRVLDLSKRSLRAIPVNILAELKLNVDKIILDLSLLDLCNFQAPQDEELLPKIAKLTLFSSHEMNEYDFKKLKEVLKKLTGLKDLNVQFPEAEPEFFEKVLCPVLNNLNQLEELHYDGFFAGPELKPFDYKTFPRQLVSLSLKVGDHEICSESLRQFTSQMRSFTNLRIFQYESKDIRCANEFVSDLPHSMPTLKSVKFTFLPEEKISPFPLELKLHLNSFLDWMISLPNLEEVTLKHPAFNPCYCNYLENCTVLPKLRRADIYELYELTDLSLCEVEYQDLDLAAILKLLLPETIEIFFFTLHMELFKPKVLDLLEERLVKCPKLSVMGVQLCVNILSEKHLYKLEKIYSSLYRIAKKGLQINYFEPGGELVRAILKGEHQLKGLQYSAVDYRSLALLN